MEWLCAEAQDSLPRNRFVDNLLHRDNNVRLRNKAGDQQKKASDKFQQVKRTSCVVPDFEQLCGEIAQQQQHRQKSEERQSMDQDQKA